MATESNSPNHGVKFDVTISIPEDYTLIPDAEHNPQIIALATWAIDEHNKDIPDLKLVKVICAAQLVQFVSVEYIIIFEATHQILRLPNEIFEAKVSESSSSRKLVEFKSIGPASQNLVI